MSYVGVKKTIHRIFTICLNVPFMPEGRNSVLVQTFIKSPLDKCLAFERKQNFSVRTLAFFRKQEKSIFPFLMTILLSIADAAMPTGYALHPAFGGGESWRPLFLFREHFLLPSGCVVAALVPDG